MSKNFYTPKTGHAASDAYFKNTPIWFDSDLLRSFCIGAVVGSLITLFIIFSI